MTMMNDHSLVMSFALELREIINIFISVLFGMLAILYGRYLISDRGMSLRTTGWRHMTPVSKMVAAWSVICLGEITRSSVVWELIHFEGVKASYLTNIVPLMISLALIIIGGACAIRIITPGDGWRRHVLWSGSVLLATLLSVLSLR